MDASFFIKNPGLVQGNQKWGLFKGYVVDNADPEHRARIRVHMYGLHADYEGISTDLLYWAEPIIPIPGGFFPPEMGARVWVMFEAGNTENPVYLGYGYANPTGRGTLPCDSGYGSEAPTETWGNHHEGYPESLVAFKTGEGTVMHSTHKLLNNEAMESEFVLEDTGGKGIQIRSYHKDEKDNTPVYGSGSDGQDGKLASPAPRELNGVMVKRGNVTRTGWPGGHKDAPGEIQVQIPDLSMELAGSDEHTAFHIHQTEEGKDSFGYEKHAISGLLHSERTGLALESDMDDSLFLNASKVILIKGMLTPPRRWAR